MATQSGENMIYFLIPVFNEEANIPQLSKSLNASGFKSKFIFIDDGSDDKTKAVLKDSFSHNDLIILSNEINSGPGFSFNKGFEWLLANTSMEEENLIITLEGDNTSDLTILPALLQLANQNNDLVLASAYLEGGGFSRSSWWRKVTSNMANGLIRKFFKINIRTLTSFYRIYNLEMIRNIKSKFGEVMKERGYICKVEILLKAKASGARIAEYPVTLLSHLRKGKSKMKVIKTGIDYLNFMIRNYNRLK